jgi:hypothetical protein
MRKKEKKLFLPLLIKNTSAIHLSLLMFSYIIEEITDAGENT